MPTRLTEASGELVEAINAKIAYASSQYTTAVSLMDRNGMQRSRANMSRFTDLRERLFSLVEEIVFDSEEDLPIVSKVSSTPITNIMPLVAEPKAQKTEEPQVNVTLKATGGAPPSAAALARWPKARPGRVRTSPAIDKDAPVEPLVAGEYTSVKDYEPYLMRAMVLLGSRARFIDIQKKTLSLMEDDDVVKPQDQTWAGHTKIPRYITQTSSLRKSLLRRQLVTQHSDKTFSMTDLGESVARDYIRAGVGATPVQDDRTATRTLVTA